MKDSPPEKGQLEHAAIKSFGSIIIGVDEVGRGCLAGPIFAAAICLDYPSINKLGSEKKLIRDSKTLSKKQRLHILPALINSARCWGVAMATPREIEQMGISGANFLAMKRALAICEEPDLVLVDGNQKIPGLKPPQQAVIKGDSSTYCIAGASIIAKTHRDSYMSQAHEIYPHYGFDSNVGYGTKSHMEALKVRGASVIHRRNFSPIKEMLADIRG